MLACPALLLVGLLLVVVHAVSVRLQISALGRVCRVPSSCSELESLPHLDGIDTLSFLHRAWLSRELPVAAEAVRPRRDQQESHGAEGRRDATVQSLLDRSREDHDHARE